MTAEETRSEAEAKHGASPFLAPAYAIREVPFDAPYSCRKNMDASFAFEVPITSYEAIGSPVLVKLIEMVKHGSTSRLSLGCNN
jgi:hypothetical protein